MNRPLMVTSYPQYENASAMHSVYSGLDDWWFPNIQVYFLQTQVMSAMVWWRKKLNRGLQKITGLIHAHVASKIVIACNSASADYSNTDEVRGIVPFGVSSVLKSNGLQKILVAGNSIVRSGISRKLFGQHGLPIRERIAQPLSIQIEKGGLSGEKLENDLQRILKPLKNYDSILLACTHYPAIENEIKKHLKPSSQLLDPVDEMVGWVQQI